tara:strand:+ start:991 stop:1263 length:273 start_codon:yes stop_codon:yes gene_type:complete
MDKIKSFVSEYGLMIALGLIIILFFRTCGLSRHNDKVAKDLKTLKENVITKEEMQKMLDEQMWDLLEIEELSDKNKIPINSLKHQRSKEE